MKALSTKVLGFALIALLGMGSGNVKAENYSPGFYYDNGESSKNMV